MYICICNTNSHRIHTMYCRDENLKRITKIREQQEKIRDEAEEAFRKEHKL